LASCSSAIPRAFAIEFLGGLGMPLPRHQLAYATGVPGERRGGSVVGRDA